MGTFAAQYVLPLLLTAVAYGQIVRCVWLRRVIGQVSEACGVRGWKNWMRVIGQVGEVYGVRGWKNCMRVIGQVSEV